MTDVERAVEQAHERVAGFVAELREQGLHVGMGPAGSSRCVTCDEPWPCASSKEQSPPGCPR